MRIARMSRGFIGSEAPRKFSSSTGMAQRSEGPGGHGERHPADWTCRLAVVDRHKETVSFKIPCGNQTCSKNNSFMDDLPSYKLHLVRKNFPAMFDSQGVSPSLITATL